MSKNKMKNISRLLLSVTVVTLLTLSICRARITAYILVRNWKTWEIDNKIYDDSSEREAKLIYLGQSSVPSLISCVNKYKYGKYTDNVRLHCMEVLYKLNYSNIQFYENIVNTTEYPSNRIRALIILSRLKDEKSYNAIKNMIFTEDGRKLLITNSNQRDIYNLAVTISKNNDKQALGDFIIKGLKSNDRIAIIVSYAIFTNYIGSINPEERKTIIEKYSIKDNYSSNKLLEFFYQYGSIALLTMKYSEEDLFCGSCNDSKFWSLLP